MNDFAGMEVLVGVWGGLRRMGGRGVENLTGLLPGAKRSTMVYRKRDDQTCFHEHKP